LFENVSLGEFDKWQRLSAILQQLKIVCSVLLFTCFSPLIVKFCYERIEKIAITPTHIHFSLFYLHELRYLWWNLSIRKHGIIKKPISQSNSRPITSKTITVNISSQSNFENGVCLHKKFSIPLILTSLSLSHSQTHTHTHTHTHTLKHTHASWWEWNRN